MIAPTLAKPHADSFRQQGGTPFAPLAPIRTDLCFIVGLGAQPVPRPSIIGEV